MSKHLPPQVKEWDIISVSFSDYSAVSFNIQSDNFIKRGPGFFISIRSLMISASWRGWEKNLNVTEYKEKYSYLENKRLYWEMLKLMEIRSFTIYYCKQIKMKRIKKGEALLQQKLYLLHKLMCESPTQETRSKWN